MHAALHAAYTRLEQAAKKNPGLIAEQELDDARAKDQESQAQIDVAKAALDATQQQLGVSTADSHRMQTLSNYSAIVAPFTGVVTMRYADTGSLIQSGTASNTQSMPVVRVAQSDLLRLRMPVPEADVPYIQIGGEVQVKVNSTGRSFVGKIIRFTRALDTNMPPQQIEADITNSYERFFTLGSGINHIESRSLPGVSLIKIYFQPGTDANDRRQQYLESRDGQLASSSSWNAAASCVEVRRVESSCLPHYAQGRGVQSDTAQRPRPVLRTQSGGERPGSFGSAALRRQVPPNPGVRRSGKAGGPSTLRDGCRPFRE
jgi:hypothetical protein